MRISREKSLEQPLWLALVHGATRHFGIEYKLIVQVNSRWGIPPSPNATPRALLAAFGFDPAEFSLYYAESAEVLPPDQPLNLKRGDRFEAQKDGRYGSTSVAASPAIEAALADLSDRGFSVRAHIHGGQLYVEVENLGVPSPPWSQSTARILIAVPATYPAGGLDAFYVDKNISHQGGKIPYEQSEVRIDNRTWALISWHYPVNRPWNGSRDNLASHIVHCRGYFLRRRVTQ